MIKRQLIGLFVVPFFSSCAYFTHSAIPAPVADLNLGVVNQGMHTVIRGETLYEIAWKYGRDYRSIAAANHICAPYVIYPGQRLNLKPLQSNKGYLILPKKEAIPVMPVIKSEKPSVSSSSPSTTSLTTTKATVFTHDWDWPLKGKIIKLFATQGMNANKGIDIAGAMGAPVKSAGEGKVVYSGSGLRGYGQLLIIKHNDTYLSAYAHNSRLLVKEGEVVKKGQIIAHCGKSDADNPRLHFEIRKNGQPINPLLMLPPLTV